MVILPSQFGAVGNGITDDTISLQQAFSAITLGSTLDLEGKSYKITDRLSIVNKTGFIISGYGSTIKAEDALPVISGIPLLQLINCTKFRLEGITIDGNRSTRIPAEVAAHNIEFRNCKNFLCTQLTSVNAVVDGFYFGAGDNIDSSTYCNGFKLINCYADNCYRQGASVINSYNFEFNGGSYSNTNGTAPEAGIDIESNLGATLSNKNGIFKGVTFQNNSGVGLLLSNVGNPKNLYVDNCEFIGNVLGGIDCAASDVTINNCYFSDHMSTTIGGVVFMSGQPTHNTKVLNCTFDNNKTIAIHTHSLTKHTTISGNVIDNNQGIGIKVRGVNNIIVNNYVSNCTDIGILSSGKMCTIQNNYINNTVGRGIYTDETGAKVINNTLEDIINPYGAYIQVVGDYSYLHGNICTAANKTEIPNTRIEKPTTAELDGRSVNLNRTQRI